MTVQLEKNKYLSKDEMIRFLKSKGVIIDPYTRNFPRFAKNNGIILNGHKLRMEMKVTKNRNCLN